MDTVYDLGQLLARGRWHRMEQRPALWVADENAIDRHEVKVHVQVDARSESLDMRYGAAHDVAELPPPSAHTVSREHRLDEDARERAKHVGAEGRERASNQTVWLATELSRTGRRTAHQTQSGRPLEHRVVLRRSNVLL
jgi:hypothetical protein